MEDRIHLKEVRRSGVITAQEIVALGHNWFKDRATGMCYLIERLPDDKLQVKESRKSVIKEQERKRTHTEIKCCDCGAIRTIKVQDAFQVKRCTTCQNRFRNTRRKRARQEAEKDNLH